MDIKNNILFERQQIPTTNSLKVKYDEFSIDAIVKLFNNHFNRNENTYDSVKLEVNILDIYDEFIISYYTIHIILYYSYNRLSISITI